MALSLLATLPAAAQEGQIQTLRDDVRSPRAPAASSEVVKPHEHHPNDPCDDALDDAESDLWWLGIRLGAAAVTAPVWVPRAILNDSNAVEGYFRRFPYENGASGSMMMGEWSDSPRRWAGRVRSEYAEDFDDLSRVGGHLLLDTTSRFGLELEMNHFEERLVGRRADGIWLGDANLVYRFAQSPRSQWRAGIGLNWLDDPADTNFGFNFTYGIDFFPVRPWVFSTAIDWGTLGSAERFHFRATAGVLLWGIETYTGYEYDDIDRFHFNGLIAGVQIWF